MIKLSELAMTSADDHNDDEYFWNDKELLILKGGDDQQTRVRDENRPLANDEAG